MPNEMVTQWKAHIHSLHPASETTCCLTFEIQTASGNAVRGTLRDYRQTKAAASEL